MFYPINMQVYEEFKRFAYILRLFSEVLKCTYISDDLLRDNSS